jgi:glycosyltransferase involved in cell wall biosynthesis
MRISAIIPAYNAERFIGAALDSVATQRPSPCEIIVVDDGSHDRTGEIVGAKSIPGLRLIRQDNAGPSAARNAALALARGDWIAFLDADDLWAADKLALQTRLAAAREEVDIWLGATEGVAIEAAPASAGAFMASFTSRPFLQLGAAFVRRSLFDRIGLFDPALTFGEDLDWLMRAQEGGAVIQAHPETVLCYRRHGANLTNDRPRRDRDFLRVLKKSVDRRRADRGPPP